MRPKVSVIIPIFNVEDYLSECIESILKQTLQDIEIILVNDGSQDTSGKICDEYSEKDVRVKVIHKKNGGPSDARNWGLDYASGEYISFVDSDDWINENMLSDMYNIGNYNKSDLIVSGSFIEFANENYFLEESFDQTYISTEDKDIKDSIFKICKLGLFNVVWNKLYRKEVIANYRFIEDAMPAEDVVFNSYIFNEIESLILMNKSYYHYMKRDIDSYVTKYSPKIYEVALDRYNSFKKLFSNWSLCEEKHNEWLNRVYFDGLQDCIINMYRSGSPLSFKDKRQFLREKILNDKYVSKLAKEYKYSSLFLKIFKILLLIKNETIMLLTYEILFVLRKNLNKLYTMFRKRQNLAKQHLLKWES